MDQSHVTNKR